MNNKTKILSRVRVYKGRIAEIVHQSVSFFPGKSIEYEIVHRPSIVTVIPVLPSGEILLVRQYRASLNRFIWEFPGGVIENGESSIEAAKRELEEETGYKAGEVELIRRFYTAPHFSDEKIYIYFASKLALGETNLQEKELISHHAITKTELETKFRNNELIDAKTLIAYNCLLYFNGRPCNKYISPQNDIMV
jgi:ADP-ribose pyrophosphatase